MSEEIIEGLKELEDGLLTLELDVAHKQLKNALMYATKPMVDEIKETTPFDESEDRPEEKARLRDAVKRKSSKKGGELSAEVGVGVFSRSLAYVAAFLELGTKHIAPRKWIQKAADRNVNKAINRFMDKLAKNIEKAGKR